MKEHTAMRKTLPITAGLIAGTLLSGTAGAATNAELEQRIQELEQTVRLLSRKQEVSEEVYTGDKAKAATAGTVKAGLDGFSLVSPDKQAELKLRGILQFDGRFGIEDHKDSDTFLFRRVRPTLEGKLGRAAFKLTPEFADDDADLVDGYIDVTLPASQVLRAGQFKPSISLERAQSASALAFIERAFPTELAPNRDRGVMLYSSTFDKRLNVEFAVTNGTADGRTATNSDVDGEQELNARVFFEPKPGIGFGVSGTSGEKFSKNDTRSASTSNVNAFLPRYRSPGQQTIFNYVSAAVADGDHTRFSPHAYAYVGPFGVMAEYIESTQDVGLGGRTEEFTNEAAQITAIWAITGEEESFKGIKPTRPGGAWELALRWSTLQIDDSAFDLKFADPAKSVESADEWAVGLNWAITQNLKAFANYTVTQFDGGAANGGDRDDEKAFFTRLQLNY
jgi:phosphate-selective porin OprO and OprP